MLLNRKRLNQIMKSNGLPVLISAKPENAIYLTSYHTMGSRTIKERLTYVVYFCDDDIAPIVLCPSVDVRHMRELSWIPENNILPFTEFKTGNDQGLITDKFSFIADQIKALGFDGGKIGVETGFLSEEILNAFRLVLPKADFIDSGRILKSARAVKTPEEITRLKEACRITEEGCKVLIEYAKKGALEDEAAAQAKAVSMLNGAETIGFCAVGSSYRSAYVHNNPRHEPVREGTVFRFDFGALYEGYWGDLARTFVLKYHNPEQRKFHDAIRAAQEAGLAAVKPGVTANDIYTAAVTAGRRFDPDLRREHVGHGLGLEVHEEPILRLGSDQVIEPGMVMCVEVGKYVPDVGGFQIEDTILVTDTGIEIFDTLPKGILI